MYRVDGRPGRSRPRSAGKQTDDAAEHERRPDVEMRAAGRALPGKRRDPQGEDDAEEPLERHQSGKQPIGPSVNVVLIFARTARRRGAYRRLSVRLTVD